MIDLFNYTGKQLADKGIAESQVHADDVSPKWSDEAYALFISYCYTRTTVTVEAIKDWAYVAGLPKPPAPGAWGAVTRRAVKNNVIVFAYFEESKNKSQHMKPVRVWRVVR